MTTERRIGVSIIGTGVGLRTILPGLRRTGRVEICAVAGRTAARAEELAGGLGVDVLTGDVDEACGAPGVDLVCVASPPALHLEHVTAVVDAGKHLYLEKPTGRDAGEAAAVAEVVGARPGTMAVVGHQLRFNPYLRRARDLIADGALGLVHALRIQHRACAFTDPGRAWTWQFEAAQGGGMRLAMGTHLVDLALFLLGGPGRSRAAHTAVVRDVRHGRRVDASATYSAMLTVGDVGVSVATTGTSHQPPNFELVVEGADADLTFDPDRKLVLHELGAAPRRVLGDDVDADWAARRAATFFSTSFTYLADAMVDALLEGRDTVPDAASPVDGVEVVRIVDDGFGTGARPC